jgi:hypothetical protein
MWLINGSSKLRHYELRVMPQKIRLTMDEQKEITQVLNVAFKSMKQLDAKGNS